jgi:hypothetical protein
MIYREPEFDNLRADKAQQADEAARERKCGTCRFFVVRPNEVEIAQIARPMAMCQPGSHCSGGAVRGMCQKWRERGAPTPQMESTQLCPLYQPGGPAILGMAEVEAAVGAGSFQKDEAAAAAAASSEKQMDGALLALGAVGLLAAAGAWINRNA